MAVQNNKKKKEAVPIGLVVLLVIALAALGIGIWLATRLKTKSHNDPQPMQPQIELQTQAGTSTEVTTTSTLTSDIETTLSSEESTTFFAATAASATAATEALTMPQGVTGISLTFYEVTMKVGDPTKMPIVTMLPATAKDKSELWTSSNQAVATVDGMGRIKAVGAGDCIIRVTSVNNPAVHADVMVTVTDGSGNTTGTSAQSGNVGTTSSVTQEQPVATTSTTAATKTNNTRSDIQVINGITYVQGILIANKTYGLPSTYNPGLDATALAAFNQMAADAKKEGKTLKICSGFRSYATQNTLYNNYCKRDGKAAADRYSARPGHSEHQTGLAMDINYAGSSFTKTPEAKWLANNCWKYGFIIRYPEGKENITGYKYESWHIRYLGKDLAEKVYKSGLTLEEYLGITSKYAN